MTTMTTTIDPKVGLAGLFRDRLLAGEILNLADLDAELGPTYSPRQIRNAMRNVKKTVATERLEEGVFAMAGTSATRTTPAPATNPETETASAAIRRRLHTGEWLNPDLIADEYGVSKSLLGVVLSELRKQGHKTRSSGRKVPGEDRYRNFTQLVPKKGSVGAAMGPAMPPGEGAGDGAASPGPSASGTGTRARKATRGAKKSRTPARAARAAKVAPEQAPTTAGNGKGEWSGPGPEMDDGGPDDDLLHVPRRRGKVKATDAPVLGARLKVVALALERGDVVVRLEGDGDLWTAVLRRGPGD